MCIKYGVAYVDFNKWQKEIINNSNPGTGYFISKNPFDVMIDSLITTYLGFSSWISKKRKLIVTVDGVHLNKKGAKGLAHLIEEDVEGKNNEL